MCFKEILPCAALAFVIFNRLNALCIDLLKYFMVYYEDIFICMQHVTGAVVCVCVCLLEVSIVIFSACGEQAPASHPVACIMVCTNSANTLSGFFSLSHKAHTDLHGDKWGRENENALAPDKKIIPVKVQPPLSSSAPTLSFKTTITMRHFYIHQHIHPSVQLQGVCKVHQLTSKTSDQSEV